VKKISLLLAVAFVAGGGYVAFRLLGDSPTATTTSAVQAATTTTSAQTTTDAPAGYEASFIEADCEFQEPIGVDVTCGFLRVPESREDVDNGRTVEIHAAVFAATDPSPAADPIVYLDGGPGGFSLEPLEFTFSTVWEPFIGPRDLVMFDQRGTGYSMPSLECEEDRQLTFELLDDDLDAAEYSAREREAVTRCRQRLAERRVDLSAYNSKENAADVADLMKALGYDEWNLFGISYGTRLAQTIMRDHPEGVRSVILDSVYTPDVSLLTGAPENLDRAIKTLLDGCAGSQDCAAAYPDLENRLFSLVDALNAAPLQLDVRDVFTQARYDAVFDGYALLGTVFQGLYSAEVIPILPQMIDELERGDTRTAGLLVTNDLANGAFFSLGMHLSVQCNEEVPFSTKADVEAADDAFPRYGEFFEGASNIGPPIFALCDVWQAGNADPIENEPVSSTIPTLVLSGEYDPITPPAWGRLAADQLAEATFLLFPGVGHGVTVSADCPRQIMFGFLDDPPSTPDVGCMSDMGPPAFKVPGQVGDQVELVAFDVDILGFGFSGVRPDGWDEIGPGAWIRGDSGIDQTAIVQQAIPGLGDPSLVVDLFSQQMGFDSSPEAAGTLEAGGRTWQLFTATIDGFPIDIGAADVDGTVAVVMLVSDDAERSALLEEVFVPALEAFETR
jgi:pimeloyl-ACP methyl ester carboxylesterase